MTLGEAGCHGSASLVPEEVGALGSSRAPSSDATSLASSSFFRASLKCFCLHDLSRTLQCRNSDDMSGTCPTDGIGLAVHEPHSTANKVALVNVLVDYL
jgi:hypothetical protein